MTWDPPPAHVSIIDGYNQFRSQRLQDGKWLKIVRRARLRTRQLEHAASNRPRRAGKHLRCQSRQCCSIECSTARKLPPPNQDHRNRFDYAKWPPRIGNKPRADLIADWPSLPAGFAITPRLTSALRIRPLFPGLRDRAPGRKILACLDSRETTQCIWPGFTKFACPSLQGQSTTSANCCNWRVQSSPHPKKTPVPRVDTVNYRSEEVGINSLFLHLAFSWLLRWPCWPIRQLRNSV